MIPGTQPEPLTELSPDEVVEWNKFVKRMPVNWFPPETWPLLAQLCRHVCQARWFGEALQETRAGLCDHSDDEALAVVERLIRCHEREGRAMRSLMTSLRLTTQQRIVDDGVAVKARRELPDVQPWMPPSSVRLGKHTQ
jgi:hypothetical protein